MYIRRVSIRQSIRKYTSKQASKQEYRRAIYQNVVAQQAEYKHKQQQQVIRDVVHITNKTTTKKGCIHKGEHNYIQEPKYQSTEVLYIRAKVQKYRRVVYKKQGTEAQYVRGKAQKHQRTGMPDIKTKAERYIHSLDVKTERQNDRNTVHKCQIRPVGHRRGKHR